MAEDIYLGEEKIIIRGFTEKEKNQDERQRGFYILRYGRERELRRTAVPRFHKAATE